MSRTSIIHALKNKHLVTFALPAALLAALAGVAFAAQDRYTLKLGKLSFGDFRGYENWKDVAVGQTETQLKVILANDVMMSAFKQGLPAEGKLFPEGSKAVKIEWDVSKRGQATLVRERLMS